jgi:hypothetical protein
MLLKQALMKPYDLNMYMIKNAFNTTIVTHSICQLKDTAK